MPDCYMLAICRGTSIDQATNNLTIFGIVEGVAGDNYPGILPLEIISIWSFTPEDYRVEFEVRIITHDIQSANKAPHFSDPIALIAEGSRLRLAMQGGVYLDGPGYKRLSMQIREKGTENWLETTAYTLLEAIQQSNINVQPSILMPNTNN